MVVVVVVVVVVLVAALVVVVVVVVAVVVVREVVLGVGVDSAHLPSVKFWERKQIMLSD